MYSAFVIANAIVKKDKQLERCVCVFTFLLSL